MIETTSDWKKIMCHDKRQVIIELTLQPAVLEQVEQQSEADVSFDHLKAVWVHVVVLRKAEGSQLI
jgi:hypothetical protein